MPSQAPPYYACQRCGNCCRNWAIAMCPNEDYARFLTYHGIIVRERRDGYMEAYGESKCVHLRTSKEHGTSCAIYEDRPELCRNWACEKC